MRLSGRSVRDAKGAFQTFEVMVEDLSERRLLEDQLRQAQKMEAVGQLTGGIAHDFNNVLSVILLNSELMAAAVEADQPVDVQDIKAIQDSAKRASSITRKLLGFSRKAELLLAPNQLDQVVAGMSSMIRTLLPESINLEMDIASEVGPALADTGSVEQMLLNLVANSRDALSAGGRVTVRVSEVALGEDYAALHPDVQPGRFVCLEVADNGLGMDEEVLKRVFDPFFSTKAPGAGTGLGMAMVYGLTKQQGGHVTIYSEVGLGTTTRLYFPCIEARAAQEVEYAHRDTTAHTPATLLLVEDEENLAAATKRALEGKGYEVLVTSDGLEALKLFREAGGRIDLVLSDLVLPGLGGIELLARLQEEHGPVRFVLTSGYSGRDLAALGGVAAVPFLRKPWVLADLLTVIRTTLDSELPPLENTNVQHPDH